MLKFLLGIMVGFVIISYYPQLAVNTTNFILKSGVCEQIYNNNK